MISGNVAPDRAALANYTESPSPQRDEASTLRRKTKYRRLSILHSHSGRDRQRKCCRTRYEKGVNVTINRDPESGYAHYSNLIRCGYSTCPTCGAKLAQARAEEVSVACRNHLSAGGSIYMLLLTIPHTRTQRLKPLMQVVRKVFSSNVAGGKAWVNDRERYGYVGNIKSIEVTYGRNGWHPHFHVLLFLNRDLTEEERDAFGAAIYLRWARGIERAGYGLCKRSLVRLSPVTMDNGISTYLNKMAMVEDDLGRTRRVGLEMARHDLKEGRDGIMRNRSFTPFQLLDQFSHHGDDAFLRLFLEYEAAMHGVSFLTWSKGLKGHLRVSERSDDDILEEPEGTPVVAELLHWQWRKVLRYGLCSDLLDLAEAGATGDDIIAYISRFGRGDP